MICPDGGAFYTRTDDRYIKHVSHYVVISPLLHRTIPSLGDFCRLRVYRFAFLFATSSRNSVTYLAASVLSYLWGLCVRVVDVYVSDLAAFISGK